MLTPTVSLAERAGAGGPPELLLVVLPGGAAPRGAALRGAGVDRGAHPRGVSWGGGAPPAAPRSPPLTPCLSQGRLGQGDHQPLRDNAADGRPLLHRLQRAADPGAQVGAGPGARRGPPRPLSPSP